MQGICITLYTYEQEKHSSGVLLYEWILEEAHKHKIQGGSAFRGIAGFGKQGVLHEEHFFELASNVPVQVILIMTPEQSVSFCALLKNAKISIPYTKTAVEFGRVC